MDLSSPTDVGGGFDDLFRPRSMQTSSEDVYGRSLSSDTSSSGRETSTRMERWELMRESLVTIGKVDFILFCKSMVIKYISNCYLLREGWTLDNMSKYSV